MNRMPRWSALCGLLVATTASAGEPSLDEVLERTARWVAIYEETLGNVIAEEIYEQDARSNGQYRRGGPRVVRHLKSEFLFVRVGDRWQGFRDVTEVDGFAVPRREERLLSQFAAGVPSEDRRRLLRQASARYNIGRIARDANVPTLPLEILRAANQAGFAFKHAGNETIAGTRTWRLSFKETARPTRVGTREGDDVPLSGRVWLDTVSGRLLRAELKTRDRLLRAELVIDFRLQSEGGLWVPTEMRERYETVNESDLIIAKATYTHFRRFDVAVDSAVVGVVLP